MVIHPALPLSGSGGELYSYMKWTGYLYVIRLLSSPQSVHQARTAQTWPNIW